MAEVSTGSGSDRVRLSNKLDLVWSETRSLPLPVLTPWCASQIMTLPTPMPQLDPNAGVQNAQVNEKEGRRRK